MSGSRVERPPISARSKLSFLVNSPLNAAAMIERFLQSIEKLKLVPHRTVFEGPSNSLDQSVRTVPIGSYVIYFRVLERQQAVKVLTIRHGARRRPKRFH